MRCKSCDTILESFECVWNQETKTHGDLCLNCKSVALQSAFELTDSSVGSIKFNEYPKRKN